MYIARLVEGFGVRRVPVLPVPAAEEPLSLSFSLY